MPIKPPSAHSLLLAATGLSVAEANSAGLTLSRNGGFLGAHDDNDRNLPLSRIRHRPNASVVELVCGHLPHACAWGVEANTEQQIKCIRTNLAQRIIEYATEGEQDVVHLKEFGLQGLPHVCAHGVRLPKAVKVASLSRLAHYSAIGA